MDKIWTIPPKLRHHGIVNHRGLLTLYRREMHRGLKIWGITLAAPAVRALLFAGLFNLIIGDSNNVVLHLPYIQFLLPIGGQLPEEPLALIFFATMGTLIVGLLSQIVGIFTTKWDHLVGVQTFLFMPIVFLSGTFFSFDKLPASIQPFARGNPIFYIVDGVRYGITGYCDSDPLTGGVIISFCFIILLALTFLLFSRGFHLYR